MKDSVMPSPSCQITSDGVLANLTAPEIEVTLNKTFQREDSMDYTAHERIRLMPIGELIGLSEWLTITQKMISEFGAVTQDPDPMHLDLEWAARNGPFGGTIAYGFLTLSLLTTLFNSAVGDPPSRDRHSKGAYVNYGL